MPRSPTGLCCVAAPTHAATPAAKLATTTRAANASRLASHVRRATGAQQEVVEISVGESCRRGQEPQRGVGIGARILRGEPQ
jgi:hypothetical protein